MPYSETRPNGKPYRARKEPFVEFFEGDWPDDASAIVLRIDRHHGEEARQMVIEEGREHGVKLVNSGTFGWWRSRNSKPFWSYDSVNGMPGWFFNVE